MKELRGNLWDYHKGDNWVVITTNGFVRSDSRAVMGRGVALQATQRFPGLDLKLGLHIRQHGNTVGTFPKFRVFTLPVKSVWWVKADISLIGESLINLVAEVYIQGIKNVYMPRPGCGNGQLDWEDVKPLCQDLLGDHFTIVEWR